MNVTPKIVARQIIFARAQESKRPAFTSETGVVRPERPVKVRETVEVWEDFCFVCGRPTDHIGEHEDMEGVTYVSRTEEYVTDNGVRWVTHTAYTYPPNWNGPV